MRPFLIDTPAMYAALLLVLVALAGVAALIARQGVTLHGVLGTLATLGGSALGAWAVVPLLYVVAVIGTHLPALGQSTAKQ